MNIIATFPEGVNKVYTKSAYQYDKGRVLILEGIELIENMEAHVSNFENDGVSSIAKTQNNMVLIPDAFFESGNYIYVWVYAKSIYGDFTEGVNYHLDENDPEQDHLITDPTTPGAVPVQTAETLYEIVIPVMKRPEVEEVENPEPGEGDTGLIYSYRVEGENLILGRE